MRQYRSKGKKRYKRPTNTRDLRPLGSNHLRPLRIEMLEERRLLSLSPVVLSTGQQSALENGLQGLATWTNSLDQYGNLVQQLPVVDQSIGAALSINGILQNQLVNNAALQAALTTASQTTTNVVGARLQQLNYSGTGLSVTVSLVSGVRRDAPGKRDPVQPRF